MNHLFSKLREVSFSVLPIAGIVSLLHFTVVPMPIDLYGRFLICSLIIILGLALFLTGTDLAITSMGKLMGNATGKSKKPYAVGIIGFVLGFFITVAEPNLNILGDQIEQASSGAVQAGLFVGTVSVGVGVVIAMALYRILIGIPYKYIITVQYGIVFAMALFISPEFLAFSFDSAAAASGVLATPFILALGLAVAQLKKGSNAEEDSFGMIGMMSTGPMIAVMAMALLLNFGALEPAAEAAQNAEGVLWPIINIFPSFSLESLIAILPITVIFFAFQWTKIKASRYEILQIVRGLVYTLLGLILFLVAVNAGFLETGKFVGQGVAKLGIPAFLPILGLVFGLVVVLAEPAVYVLAEQVRDVTGGHISKKALLITLSLGVGSAVFLSMLRIMIEPIQLWHFLLPGLLLSVILSYYVAPLFVGLAFDAGGVASGPMTATFILALTQGAAHYIPTADLLIDGFGVIATVAMTPILAILILGTLFKIKTQKLAKIQGAAQ